MEAAAFPAEQQQWTPVGEEGWRLEASAHRAAAKLAPTRCPPELLRWQRWRLPVASVGGRELQACRRSASGHSWEVGPESVALTGGVLGCLTACPPAEGVASGSQAGSAAQGSSGAQGGSTLRYDFLGRRQGQQGLSPFVVDGVRGAMGALLPPEAPAALHSHSKRLDGVLRMPAAAERRRHHAGGWAQQNPELAAVVDLLLQAGDVGRGQSLPARDVVRVQVGSAWVVWASCVQKLCLPLVSA